MKFTVITLFPDVIASYCRETILGRAQRMGVISVQAMQLRDFATDKHKTVDDTPYGGGAGMVIRPDVVYAALQSCNALSNKAEHAGVLARVADVVASGLHIKKTRRTHTVLLSPRGRMFTQSVAQEFASSYDEIVFVCGRYEGVDNRVSEYMVDEELSVGEYVLAGGELPALVVIETVSRLVPGVLGNSASLYEETFGLVHSPQSTVPRDKDIEYNDSEIKKEYPQYTKPVDFMGWKVPKVLLSGDHGEIKKWRESCR